MEDNQEIETGKPPGENANSTENERRLSRGNTITEAGENAQNSRRMIGTTEVLNKTDQNAYVNGGEEDYPGLAVNSNPETISNNNTNSSSNRRLWSTNIVPSPTQISTSKGIEEGCFGGYTAPPALVQGPVRFGEGNEGINMSDRRNRGQQPSEKVTWPRHQQIDEGEDSISTRRKRNRLDDERAGLGFSTAGAGEALEALMEDVHKITRSCQKGSALKEAVDKASNILAVEISKLLTKVVQKQEENTHLLQQIVFLQSCGTDAKSTAKPTYAEVARGNDAREVASGKRLPAAQIPAAVRLSPAEKTLIIKNDVKDAMATKQQQHQFRIKLKEAVGEELAGEISAVRPTRYGGFTVITSTETARDLVADKVVEREVATLNRIVRPRKRQPRMVCRSPPDITPTEFLTQLYGRHNPEFRKVPQSCRYTKINITRLGWVFEFSTAEALACNAQGGKVRHSFGLEANLEEFIPLQQCYNCCAFGHEAKECRATNPKCRLCAREGHSGRDCPFKEDRTRWRCYNCKHHNELRGTHLSVEHAAAQMHVCAVAAKERDIRREQLRAAGVYTSPNISNIYPSAQEGSNTGRKKVPEQTSTTQLTGKMPEGSTKGNKEGGPEMSQSKVWAGRRAAEVRRRSNNQDGGDSRIMTRRQRTVRNTGPVGKETEVGMQGRVVNRGAGLARRERGEIETGPNEVDDWHTVNRRKQKGIDRNARQGNNTGRKATSGKMTRSTNGNPEPSRRLQPEPTTIMQDETEEDELDDLDL